MLKQVITSWQVIIVTVGLVLYISIVNYVARSYHRPLNIKKISFKPKKAKPAAAAAAAEGAEGEDVPITSDSNDDLGLEED